jgi:putative restriction endonuclease
LPEIPLSITTAPVVEGKPRPYDDELDYDGMIRYRYRGTDPAHRDNVGLRLAMKRQVPLVYFFGLAKGEYMPAWPVFIVGDDPAALTFTVAVDEKRMIKLAGAPETPADEDRRRYVTQHTKVRLHQQEFRLRVLRAYQNRCAICRLRHQELLEAAHILPDWHPDGQPVLPNGLSLCQLHHGAFDRNILGIRPDLVIELRKDILEETDGPMLQHGLQGFQGQKIWVPVKPIDKPDPERLEERYEMFRKAV